MKVKELVLTGDKGSSVDGEKVTFAVKNGFIYMAKSKGRKRIDWTGFHLEEAEKIRDFFIRAVKQLKKQGVFADLTHAQIRKAGREAAKALGLTPADMRKIKQKVTKTLKSK